MKIKLITGINGHLCNVPVILMFLLQVGQVGGNTSSTCSEEHMPVLGRNEYGEWIIRPDTEYFYQEYNGDQTLFSDMHGEIYPD